MQFIKYYWHYFPSSNGNDIVIIVHRIRNNRFIVSKEVLK